MSRDKLAETEDAWFDDDFGGTAHHDARRPRPASRRLDGRTRGQLLVLGLLVAVTFATGLALGAFSGHARSDAAPTPAPVPAQPTPAQQAALDTAAQWGGTALLSEDALSLALGELLAERRADLAPVPPVDGEPVAAGADADPGAAAATEPVIAKAPVEKAPARAPVEKAPVIAKAPVEKAPVEKAPVEKAPVEKAPVEKAPVELAAPAGADAQDKATAAVAEAKAKAADRDWKGAVTAYTAALAAAPGDARALIGRGLAYFELKQADLATKDLEAVLARNPTHATALLTMGSIAQDQGKKSVARDYYERYLKRYPTGRRAAEARALLEKL